MKQVVEVQVQSLWLQCMGLEVGLCTERMWELTFTKRNVLSTSGTLSVGLTCVTFTSGIGNRCRSANGSVCWTYFQTHRVPRNISSLNSLHIEEPNVHLDLHLFKGHSEVLNVHVDYDPFLPQCFVKQVCGVCGHKRAYPFRIRHKLRHTITICEYKMIGMEI